MDSCNELCTVYLALLIHNSIAIVILISAALFLSKFNKSKSKQLFCLHKWRFISVLLLLIVQVLEFCESLLHLSLDRSTSGPHLLYKWTGAFLIVITTFLTTAFVRVIEVRNKVEWIYGVIVIEGVQLALQLWKLYELSVDLELDQLQPFLTAVSSAILALIVVLDTLTTYAESKPSRRIQKKVSNLDELNVGLKNPFSTCLSKITFWWVTPLLIHGYTHPLELSDLGQLHEPDSSRYQYDQFLFNLKRQQNEIHLWRSYFRTYWKDFVLGGILRLFSDAATLIGPIAISTIVEYLTLVQQENGASEETEEVTVKAQNTTLINGPGNRNPNWTEFLTNGWITAIIILMGLLGQSVLSQASTDILNMVGIRLKLAIQGLIYRKTLSISTACFAKSEDSKGDDKSQDCSVDAGLITSLMSEDANNIMSFFWIVHYFWAIPLKIVVVIYVLYLKLGWSAVAGALICVLIFTPLQFLVGKLMSRNANKISSCTDDRLQKLNEILMGIRIIKLNAWDKVFHAKVEQSRSEEMIYLKRDSIYWTFITFLIHSASVIMALITFLIYSNYNSDAPLESSRVFSALALFNQLTISLFIFPMTVPVIISAITSTRRLTRFLNLPEIEKRWKGAQTIARVLSRSDNSLDVYENELQSNLKEIISEEIKDNDSTGPENLTQKEESVPGKEKALSPSSPPQKKQSTVRRIERSRVRPRPTISSIRSSISTPKDCPSFIPDSLIVKIRIGVFSWDRQRSDRNLTIENLEIPKDLLTIIVGPSGSGKSSLLAAFLDEIYLVSGDMIWNKYSTIAFVPQTPWLLNATIKENIIFGETFRPKRYEKVLESCALKPDIDLMPNGDETEINERGINLSGGQRQRVAIARALYSSANVIILDDPFASLDNEVTKLVFEKALKSSQLRQKRTILMSTQNLQFIYSADYLVALENLQLKIAGTYDEIEKSDRELVDSWAKIINKESLTTNLSPNKTARERWKLLKIVTKLGLQQQFTTVYENSLPLNTSNQSILFSPKRSSLFGSRNLTYDISLPMDQHGDDGFVESRRRSTRKHKFIPNKLLRANSLQIENLRRGGGSLRVPVVRNISSPTTLGTSMPTSASQREPFGFGNFLRRISFRQHSIKECIPEDRLTPGSEESDHFSDVLRGRIFRVENRNSGTSIKSISEIEELTPDPESKPEILITKPVSVEPLKAEERLYGEIPLSVYSFYLKSCGLGVVFAFCLFTCLWQALRVYTDIWLRNWTDAGTSEEENVIYYLKVYSLLSGACIVLSLIATPIGQYMAHQARKTLHQLLLTSLMSNPIQYFQTTPIGQIINRFGTDMSVIDKKIGPTSQRLLQFLLLCVCAIFINSAITPWFLLITIPVCFLYYVIQLFYRSSARELQRIENITTSPIISHFSETISGIQSIRAYNQESRFMEALFKRLEDNNVAFVILNSCNRWLGIVLDFLGVFIVFVAIIGALVASRTIDGSRMDPSLVGLAINYTLMVPVYLNWVVKLVADIEMYVGAVERLQQFMDVGQLNSHSAAAITTEYKPVPISWPTKGDIVFEDVSLRHENQQQNAITKLNLTIPAGQRVGICGRTGSGKSSVALALFGAVRVTQGRILIDDIDVGHISAEELRSRLSIIPQDVVLFNGTVRENLDPRNHYTDLELWNSLEMAQLKELVINSGGNRENADNGLEMRIVDGGRNFSEGQKQLFCLARAILRGSVCLVLDEATSSLDPTTESRLLETAGNAFQGRTIITIAHRLYSLLNYDRILVLENGQIVEDGHPKDLCQNTNSKFYKMLKASQY